MSKSWTEKCLKDPTYDIFVKRWGFKDAKYDISMSHMRLMIGQKVTELKNGNQGNQATMEPMYFIYKHEKKIT